MGVKGIRGKKKNDPSRLSHRELCFDLAHAKASRFVEVPLGSVWLDKGLGIADVVTIKHSYTQFNLDIYECKVSRADFLGDVKSGKYKKYLKHCNRLYFAVPKGLVEKHEVPEGVGLVVKNENGWYTLKSAEKREIDYDKNLLLSLLFYNGRAFNRKRIDLGSTTNTYSIERTPNKTNLKGLGNKIKESLINYDKLTKLFRDLVYTVSSGKKWNNSESFEKEWLDKLNKIKN